ncbi:cupin domain-containing protein [Lentithecium fluviatile CBS 122367]|uniref:Cupin domain-containing protein n=1 Tax=Lentithecium fluviatile CBS 122367 TaxID=1168545 RepID=A0A6G1J350_9PLEO|nr:cupin domain-containing protein [Lentithecium fluviatile CBS 122367]
MSQETEQLLENGLRPAHRYITTHDSNGKTGFSEAVPEPLKWQVLENGARFSLAYATEDYPVNLTDNKDVEMYQKNLADLPGITIPGGTVLRMVDMDPGSISPMHRTISCDYGVVLEGEVELILDSGAKRLMKRGDISIQRGTNHAWRNTSETKWARMLFVLQEAQPLLFNGKPLEEDYGNGMNDVKPSKK